MILNYSSKKKTPIETDRGFVFCIKMNFLENVVNNC